MHRGNAIARPLPSPSTPCQPVLGPCQPLTVIAKPLPALAEFSKVLNGNYLLQPSAIGESCWDYWFYNFRCFAKYVNDYVSRVFRGTQLITTFEVTRRDHFVIPGGCCV
jgi:hypothetical protein